MTRKKNKPRKLTESQKIQPIPKATKTSEGHRLVTPERLARALEDDDVETFEVSKSENWRAMRLLDGAPLQKLMRTGQISEDQYSAGCQFFKNAYQGGILSSGVIDPTRVIVDGGPGHHVSDIALAALQEFNMAVKILPPDALHIATQIIIYETSISEYVQKYIPETRADAKKAIAVERLKGALSILAHHYHPSSSKPRRHTATHGMAADARPTIMLDDRSKTNAR